MQLTIPCIFFCLACIGLSEEVVNHRFDSHGAHQPEGLTEATPKILALADKPMILIFSGLPVDCQPVVRIQRVTSTRRITLPDAKAEFSNDVWQLSWTPPETRGTAQYEIHFEGEPKRVVRIETRDPKWLEATREALANADWQARGLNAEEINALANLGIRTQSNKATPASLEIRPTAGDAARRRIVWDEENPTLLVWRSSSANNDLEARAPRWWISPLALATDHGLIRFLDLFSEPPLNP